jgi:leader peptidase (prepilin peptidase)/N-methyltransferase
MRYNTSTMLTVLNILVLVLVFAFGAVVGSFLNVLIYRIPLKLEFVHGFSFCPSCEHRLKPLDLVPIFSYLLLRRKCRYCHEPISPRYMIVELLGGILALCSWLAFVGTDFTQLLGDGLLITVDAAPFLIANPQFLGISAVPLAAALYFIALALLLVIAFIDADTMEIPNGLNIALGVCALLSFLVAPEVGWLSHLIGLVAISVPLLIITLVIPGAFGGGDVKLMAAAGLLLGWQAALVATFIGIIIGGVQGVYLLATRKKDGKGHFAFGPALCVGIAVAMFFAPTIITWYLGLFF